MISLASVAIIRAIFWAGWATVLAGTCLIGQFELFGLRQACARLGSRTLPAAEFKTPARHKLVRHPIYLGFLLAFWATSSMSEGHLLFAAGTPGHIPNGHLLGKVESRSNVWRSMLRLSQASPDVGSVAGLEVQRQFGMGAAGPGTYGALTKIL